MNRKYCILLMHSYYGKVWWCQFGLTAIKKNKKTNTLDDKETFLSANSWIFSIAILWDGYYKIGKNDKKQQLSILNCSIIFKFIFSWHFSHSDIKLKHAKVAHVYLEKNKWLNFNIFPLNSVIFLRRPKIICIIHCIFIS